MNKPQATTPLLSAKGIKKYFPIRKGLFLRQVGQVKAVDDVSLSIHPGETLGLVGESGCGKSTLGRTLIRLYEPTSGSITFRSENFGDARGEKLRQLRQQLQMVFQDPYAALNPRMTISKILMEPYVSHQLHSPSERQDRVVELLKEVGLSTHVVNRYPHEFSGGQRQRVNIARALALEPECIIADEPVSALDVSIQAQILNLMKELQEKRTLTYLFISHDLSVVEFLCDRIAVMYLGQLVEVAKKEDLFNSPLHPYTQALLESIPRIGRGKKKMRKVLEGDVPSPINPPSGCPFHNRCPKIKDICKREKPKLKRQGNQEVACWLFE